MISSSFDLPRDDARGSFDRSSSIDHESARQSGQGLCRLPGTLSGFGLLYDTAKPLLEVRLGITLNC